MASTSSELKKKAKQAGINIQGLFPKSKIDARKKLTPYQQKKIKAALADKPTKSGINWGHFKQAGFTVKKNALVWNSKTLHLDKIYKSEGESSFYSMSFFGGVAHVQLIPIIALPKFLEDQIKMDVENGKKFYDKITLREGDKNMWGQDAGFGKMYDSAEKIYLMLTQYMRHGSLVGEGGSFNYIQVCFINFAD
jgi:hypothetical protein